MMLQRRCNNICKPIWRINSYRSRPSSPTMSRRALLQQRLYTQFSSNRICSHHVHTLSLCNNYHYYATSARYRHLSPSYINNRQYSQSFANHLSSGSIQQQQQTSASSPPIISEAQKRSAQLELDRMVHSTSRLLSLDLTTTTNTNNINSNGSKISEAIVNEARVAIHYWSRRWYMHYHPGFGRNAKKRKAGGDYTLTFDYPIHSNSSMSSCSSDGSTNSSSDTTNQSTTDGSYGAQQAEKLLNWSIHNNLISHDLFNNTHLNDVTSYEMELSKSPNLNLVNIIDTYLLDTSYGSAGGSSSDGGLSSLGSEGVVLDSNLDDSSNSYYRSSKHFTITPSYITSVINATRILKQMKLLHSQFPKYIYPDTLSIKAELNVWSKRAILVSRHDLMYGDMNSVGKFGTVGSGSNVSGVDGGKNDPRELLKMMEIQDSKVNGTELYDDESYTLQGCLDQMEDILHKAEEQYVNTKDERLLPSCDWYNHTLGTWARSYDLPIAIQKTKEILHGMEVYDDTKNQPTSTTNITDTDNAVRQCWASPNRVSYNSVLYCLTRDSGKSTAKEAQALLQRMKDRYNNNNNIDVKPDEVTYGSVLHALAQAGMGYEAEGILHSLEDDMDRDADAIIPTLTIYNSVLNAWANSHQHNAPWRAESILERMKILTSTKKNIHVEPDSISLSTVMMCYSRSKTRKGAEQGEQLLNDAIQMYSKGNTRMKPDSIMFNCAIQGWTNISGIEKEQGSARNNVIPAERAERLLQKMNDSNIDVRPGVQTFNIILDCWAKSKQRNSAERAVKLLRDMPSYNVVPDEVSYNSTLHAMAMSKEGSSWVKCAEDMFQEMKDNNVPISQITYHVLMNIYGKSKDVNGAVKVEELLRSMDIDHFKPSEFSYNICMDAYARRGDHRKATSLLEEMISLAEKGNREFQPTIHSFASVVNALAKSGDADAVPRAEAIVQKVEELDYVSSNSILYNSLIDCLVKSRHRDNAAQAEEILLRMEDMNRSGNSNVRPNSYAYSMVLTACARSKEPGAAERANRIMLRMEQLFKDGNSDVVANSRCYSAVITAWARSNSPDAVDHAFTLIDRMEQNGRDGSPHSKPDAHCYNACIHAIAKSQQRGKARRCREVLQRMSAAKDDGFYEAAPNLITYSTILNACAFTSEDDDEEGKKEAFDLARSCFQTILSSKDMDPDVSSFTNFFVVIQRHLKHGPIRDQFAEAIFHEGCKRGKMGRQVINSFRKASPTAARKLLSKYKTTFPQEWSKKIKYDGYKSL